MRDQISNERANLLHPAVKLDVINRINFVETGFPITTKIRIVQGLRTFEEQDLLYRIGRTLKGANVTPRHPMGSTVTNARGGHSWHNYGLAIDFAIMYDLDNSGTYETLSWDTLKDNDKDGESDWQEVVKAFKEEGFEWGGDWLRSKDNPHLEKRFGMPEDCSLCLSKYNLKYFITGTNFIKV